MQRRTFLAALTGSIGVLSGCLGDSGRALPEPPGGNWRQRARDAENTAAADATVPSRGTPAWEEGELGVADPVVDDGTVFCVGDVVTALDARTGDKTWEHELPGTAENAPALTDEAMLVAAAQHLLALDRADGAELWSTSLPRPADGALTADPPLVTVPLAPRRGETGLLAIDIGTGDRIWGDRTLAARSTAIGQHGVHVTGYKQDGNTGIIRGLAIDDGSELWTVELEHPDTAPVVADDVVLTCDDGTVAARDPADGTRLRELAAFDDRIEAPPATADGTAYLGTTFETRAISTSDGSTIWQHDGGVSAGISVGRDAVVVATEVLPEASAGGIAAFERSSGDIRWEHQIEGFDAIPTTAPVLADGAVFHGSNESDGVVVLGDLPPEKS
jgi:outer membrane protein assembly factor BamB